MEEVLRTSSLHWSWFPGFKVAGQGLATGIAERSPTAAFYSGKVSKAGPQGSSRWPCLAAAAGHYPAKLAPLDFGWVLRSLKLSLGIFCLVIDMNKKISAFYFLHSSNFATWVPAPACSDRFLRKNLDLLKTRVTIPCLE
jgi:hypothetical protein